MEFIKTTLKDAYLVNLVSNGDSRGSFQRMFCQKEFAEIGFKKQILQINHSITKARGTLRGMHYQVSPASEIKIIHVIKGEIYDVIVDMRPGSETFLKWVSHRLNEKKPQLLYVPEGFAHGFQTLSNNVNMLYHHTEYYNPELEKGLRYDDPKLSIDWPLPVLKISERDKSHPLLNDIK